MSWTDERIGTLTKMWEGGATASQIADKLGGVSRNAVIGKAHRLGLKSRPSPVKANEEGEEKPVKKKDAAAKPAKPGKSAVKPAKPARKPARPGSIGDQQARLKGFALDLSAGGADDDDADFDQAAA